MNDKDELKQIIIKMIEYYKKMFIIYGDHFNVEYPFSEYYLSANEQKFFIRDQYYTILLEISYNNKTLQSILVTNNNDFFITKDFDSFRFSNIELTGLRKNRNNSKVVFSEEDYFKHLIHQNITLEYNEIFDYIDFANDIQNNLYDFNYLYIDNKFINLNDYEIFIKEGLKF